MQCSRGDTASFQMRGFLGKTCSFQMRCYLGITYTFSNAVLLGKTSHFKGGLVREGQFHLKNIYAQSVSSTLLLNYYNLETTFNFTLSWEYNESQSHEIQKGR